MSSRQWHSEPEPLCRKVNQSPERLENYVTGHIYWSRICKHDGMIKRVHGVKVSLIQMYLLALIECMAWHDLAWTMHATAYMAWNGMKRCTEFQWSVGYSTVNNQLWHESA